LVVVQDLDMERLVHVAIRVTRREVLFAQDLKVDRLLFTAVCLSSAVLVLV
jgi:hypothetical protein